MSVQASTVCAMTDSEPVGTAVLRFMNLPLPSRSSIRLSSGWKSTTMAISPSSTTFCSREWIMVSFSIPGPDIHAAPSAA